MIEFQTKSGMDSVLQRMVATVKIHMQLTCTVREDKETNSFVSHCPALNVFSAGNTELEALEAIRSALGLYVRSLYEHNRLDDKFLSIGFLPVGNFPELPETPEQFIAVQVGKEDLQQVQVDIPLLLRMNNLRQPELVPA